MPDKSDYRDKVGIVLGGLRIEDMPWEPMFLVGRKRGHMREINDEQVREIYAQLIGASFEATEGEFAALQAAWQTVARILGVWGIANNGHGRVRWLEEDDDGEE